ncbi:MAG: hypothetical protein OEM02_00245 [Desulfobulbaceae bacterium]|nr:hypothetical protein [Desulfobulbaceae bacterium]
MKKKRLFLYFIIISMLPILVLAAFFPERLVRESSKIERLYSVSGADIVVFAQYDCSHCRAFKKFALHQGWSVEYYDIAEEHGREVFKKLRGRVPQLTYSTPTIVINAHIFQGYDNEENIGKKLDQVLTDCRGSINGCLPFAELLEQGSAVSQEAAAGTFCSLETPSEECGRDERFVFDLWLFGETDLQQLSLPVLSILLGFLDGFNPCAMWVLVSLLTLLLALNDMRKMVIIGLTFLFVSGAMYYLFIAAWLNVFILLGYNFWVQKSIGLVAVGAGVFYLYQAFGTDPNACKVTGHEQRKRITVRMEKLIRQSAWLFILGGTVVLAVSVNMIELVCTAGLPAVYTQILANNPLTILVKHLYLGLYILFYMLDDMVIFLAALFTMRATGLTTRYRVFTSIVGGVLMYSLGLLMIFFPDALILGS